MTPERWQQIDKLVEQALEQEPSQRADFLDKACASDEELRREVESLLSAHEQAGSFIGEPVMGVEIGLSDSRMASDVLGGNSNLTGKSLGHYQLIEKLGAGGMGVVYKAQDSRLRRLVAIKVLSAESVADPDRKRRFVQEARAASGLNHPNIITIYDIGQADGVDFIAMEYVEGKTLERLIPRKGMRVAEALKHAIQITDALATAHAAGIIHRDLKPGNVMVTEKGQVKVLDFGLAKLTERSRSSELEATETLEVPSQSLTEEGMILGTVAYMSPEQAEGKILDARSDIFSFGSLLYEMVTGRKAFQGESNMAILSAILREEPRPVGQIVEGLPPEAERIINRCLRKDRERRWQSISDVTVALQELKEEADPGREATPEMPQSRRRLGLLWAAGALILLTAVLAFLWFYRSGSKPPLPPIKATPLTTDPGFELAPSFSPDGKQVVYVADGGRADWGIYVRQIGSGNALRRTRNPIEEVSPVWSPDGVSIAFLRKLGLDRAAVLTIPALQGPERKLAELNIPQDFLELGNRILCWVPDGKYLIASEKSTPYAPMSLVLVSVENGEKRKLTTPPVGWAGDLNPALSPDGRALAFCRYSVRDTLSELYVLPISEGLTAGGEPRRVTFDEKLDMMPTWTSDGRELVFVRGTNQIYSLWRIKAFEPGAPEPLPFAGEGADSPSISLQGNRLVYVQSSFDTDIWRVEIPDSRNKSAAPMKWISSTRVDHEARVSPDGKKIALISYRSGNPEVWIFDSDGSNPVQVTSMNGPIITGLGWFSDGERVDFTAVEKEKSAVYSVGTQGGKPVWLGEGSSSNNSRDGQWIYFCSNRSGQTQIWKMPAKGGNPLQVTRNGGEAPVESKDGKTLFYLKDDGLWKIPTKGGEETKILDSIYQDCFAVGHGGIYFIPKPLATSDLSIVHSSHLFIQYYDFSSGKTRHLIDLPKDRYVGYGFDISPDERWILFTLDSGSIGSDLMLVENFR